MSLSICCILSVLSKNKITMNKIKVETHMLSGGAWFAAWLFTLGFLKLTFWKGVLAVVAWPYFLGAFFSAV
jgi:hypothetical protein